MTEPVRHPVACSRARLSGALAIRGDQVPLSAITTTADPKKHAIPMAMIHVGHEYSQQGRYAARFDRRNSSDRAESIAPACKLRENNKTLTTIRVKHGEARL